MRFLHTADWHLGRSLHGRSLLDDQAHVLDQLVALCADARPDALVIAGDLYDRAVPPTDAVRLFDDTLRRVHALGVPVLAISGNHDGHERLSFGAWALAAHGVHLAANVTSDARRVTLADADGPVHFDLVPFADPHIVRDRCADEPEVERIRDHDAALRTLVRRARGARPAHERAVLVAHAYVAGSAPSDSERPLAIGGSEVVGVDALAGYAYVALGHLHRPQSVGGPAVRYAGSPLKYSASECGDRKGVALVTLDAMGACTVEPLPLAPRRDLRRVEGTLAALLASPDAHGPSSDYLVVRLLDDGPVLDPMGRLRERFPNVLHLERAAPARPTASASAAGVTAAVDDVSLFDAFAREYLGRTLDDAERAELRAAIADLEADEPAAEAIGSDAADARAARLAPAHPGAGVALPPDALLPTRPAGSRTARRRQEIDT